VLASAGDDGNVLLWVPAENQTNTHNFEEGLEDKESWRVRTMCRSIGSEIYDLAWSPDGVYFITGSMDNVARIYNAQTGTTHHPQHHGQLLKHLQALLYGKSPSTTTTCRAWRGIR
jgi:WD40 repeat protein